MMDAQTLRRRHPVPDSPSKSWSSELTSKFSRPKRRQLWSVSAKAAFALLLGARLLSAWLNIIHDCDEVFNYWEPLHYLLYGYGLQTWEYSAQFALRPYLYLLLHTAVAGPAALWYGSGTGKVRVFYLTKAALGCCSALSETLLYRAACKHVGQKQAHIFLLLLCVSSGMFTSTASLLPSSFTMYMLTAAAAAVLNTDHRRVVLYAVVGVIWGWAVAGIAFLPYAVYLLLIGSPKVYLPAGVVSMVGTALPMVGFDRLFYGKWTFSLWNFIRYNVVGGGDSALYGVEDSSYYLRNGANNLNLIFVLGLAYPLVALLDVFQITGNGWRPRILIALSPIYVWLIAITALPHKEERFMYVIYPLMCLAAATTLASLPTISTPLLSRVLPRRIARMLSRAATAAVLATIVLLSVSRTAALLLNYSAPMSIYRHLPEIAADVNSTSIINVCVGDEWHRYPSSFFLPGPNYRLQFVKSGFDGLLPAAFDAEKGGTAAAPDFLNNKNLGHPSTYWDSDRDCHYLIALSQSNEDIILERWQVVSKKPFVELSRSPALYRALYVPRWTQQHLHWGQYTLLASKEHGARVL